MKRERMKWSRENPVVSRSDAGYTVCALVVDGVTSYRASHQGQFIGGIYKTGKQAAAACEKHRRERGND